MLEKDQELGQQPDEFISYHYDTLQNKLIFNNIKKMMK